MKIFKKNIVNPIYEIEKQLIKDRVIITKIKEDGKFDTTEKIMFDGIEFIYNKALEGRKQNKYGWYMLWTAVGGIIGFIIGALLILQYVKKV